MKLKLFLMLCLVAAANANAASEGSSGRGGGDTVGLEFSQALASGLNHLSQKSPDTYKQISSYNLATVLKDAQILVVDQPLNVTVGGVTQESVAVNYPDRKLIEVNRYRWNQIRNSVMREGIALHEIASLKRLESTGHYPYSGSLVAALGQSQTALANSVIIPIPESLSGLGTLYFPVSQRASEDGADSVNLVLRKCGDDDTCGTELRWDIDANYISFNNEIKLRPGRYALSLRSSQPDAAPYMSNPIYIQIDDGQKYTIPFTEVYLPTPTAGNYTAEIMYNLDDDQQLTGVLNNLKYKRFDMPEKIALKPLEWKDFFGEVNTYESRYYGFCSSVLASSGADPVSSGGCRKAIQKGEIDFDALYGILNYQKSSTTQLSYLKDVRVKDFYECANVTYTHIRPTKEIATFLSQNTDAYVSGENTNKWDATTCFVSKAERTPENVTLASVQVGKDHEKAVLLMPGRYVIRLTNESSQTEESPLVITGQSAAVTVSF